jgi:hypothetical protein
VTRPARTLLVTMLVALGALSSGACGHQGPPVAPETRLPAAVTDLQGIVRPEAIELGWTLPSRRTDGTRLADLAITRVYRSEDAGGGEPQPALLSRGRIRGYDEIATIRLSAPAPATVERGRVTLIDRRGLATGRRYTYVVLSEDSTGRVSPPSARVSLAFIAAPDPPTGLVAEAGEREARLAWQPSARLTDGGPVGATTVTYQVLRAPAADVPPSPLPGEVTGTTFVDRNLENDRTYHYAVRAIRTDGAMRAVGATSPTVAVTPVDTTPPSPPRELVAVVSDRAVRLSWLASPEADVAGYVIHRAMDGGAPVRLGSVGPTTTVFIDRDVPRGRYRYTVSAEDASARRNESRPSNEVSVSVP